MQGLYIARRRLVRCVIELGEVVAASQNEAVEKFAAGDGKPYADLEVRWEEVLQDWYDVKIDPNDGMGR